MADLKWADVAHYYTKSSLDVVIEEDGATLIAYDSIFAPSGRVIAKQHRGEGRVDHPINAEIGQYQPILRHLEDMTEGEAREWFRVCEGFEWPEGGYEEHSTALDRLRFFIKVMWAYEKDGVTVKNPIFSPAEFHWMLGKGFNVFGLPEGEYIRKEVSGE